MLLPGSRNREGSTSVKPSGRHPRRRQAIVLALAATGAALYSLVAGAATPIPVPNPLVIVTTHSHGPHGPVTRTIPVPVGGVPVPIDVDGQLITGLLVPDIDVSVALVAADELPGRPLVPSVTVQRHATAVLRNAPAPPLRINAKIEIRDAGNNLEPIATVDYGFETPPGAKVPPLVRAKLVGPVEGGFVDPLEAKIESPGYSGPLQFNVRALTEDLDAKFALNFDSLPEFIRVVQDPRDDGFDALYEHRGPVSDIHLDADASLRTLTGEDAGRLLEIGANVERLPQRIALHSTNTSDSTFMDYNSSSALNKPDVAATYRDTDGDGNVVSDADVKVSGLPFRIQGLVETLPGAGTGSDIDKVKFDVLDGEQIDAVDFLVRNWIGDPGNLPEVGLQPEQHVAIASRTAADGTTRYRSAGRILGIRHIAFERTGDDNETLDVNTDVGPGTVPLRAILDTDDRPTGAADARRLKLDTTVNPLPSQIHAVIDPSNDPADPIRLTYDSSSTLDILADVILADGAADGCGQPEVTCAKARVDKVPTHLAAELPGEDGTDFSLSHNGGATNRPDVRATLDQTGEQATDRTWVRAELLRVPNEVDGRLDAGEDGVLKAAEFHGCQFDYSNTECTSPQGAIGRVSFTVRDQPSRGDLPPRPDTSDQFVTLISRQHAPDPKRFEVMGRVDEVRNVVFHQLDTVPGDEVSDGVLGVLIDVGAEKEFDLVVDDESDALDESKTPPVVIGDAFTDVAVNVDKLPSKFTACIRETNEEAPPDPGSLPDDELLAPCERNDVISPDSGEHAVTPLAAAYTSENADGTPAETKVTADVTTTEPDLDDKDATGDPIPATEKLHLVIDKVPGAVRADVIPPIAPDPKATPAVGGRKLKLRYDALSRIDDIDFSLESRRASSVCEDPRPNRKALCVSGHLHDLPDFVEATFDPDDAKGDITVDSEPPAGGAPKFSIMPFHLSKVSPEEDSTPLVLDADIEGITPKLRGKIQSLELDGESPPGTPTLAQQLATCSNLGLGNVPIDDDGDGKANALDDDCEKDPARLTFNACPPGAPSPCNGIDKITFTATNSLVGDPLPPVPATSPAVPGLEQEFSFMALNDDFRAKGLVRNLKELSYSKLEDLPSNAPSRVTTLRAAFGNGTPLRAYVDRDTGTEAQRVDAIITDAPKAITVCLRDKSNIADLKAGSANFCDDTDADDDGKTDQDKLALQTRLDSPAAGTLPDIDLRKLELTKGGGAEFLTASANIEDLAEKINVLSGKGDDTELLVEGRRITGNALADVARRVTFDFRNFRGSDGIGFPWGPLDGGLEPEGDARNNDTVETARRNYIRLVKDKDGDVRARGSIPGIKTVSVVPRACADDGRFPAPDTTGFTSATAPAYQCVKAVVAPNRPLGLAVRTLDDKNEILSVEEGHITSMPDSLEATIAKSPDTVKLAELCADGPDANTTADVIPCRPPMISLKAPDETAPTTGRLDARLAIGALNLNNKLRSALPDDPLSKRLDYELKPRSASFPEGARVKVGTEESTDGLALRLGLKIDIPKFLDLDPPTLYDCKHTSESPGTNCAATGVGKEHNAGFESKDIFFRLVAAEDKHLGNPPAGDRFLGRVALMVEPFEATDKTQIVMTGMPDPDDKDPVAERSTKGASSKFAEDFPAAGDVSEKGFLAPAHLDAQVYLRDDYRAVKDGKNQIKYAQIDGRVNAPLSMVVRLNERPPSDEDKLKKYVSPLNRSNTKVAPVQLTVRNAPGSNNQDTYGDPTFRVRAEIRDAFQEDKELSLGEKIYTCNGAGYGIQIPALLTFCALLPVNAENRYLDVQLNADPHATQTTTSGSASRTVDAVAGPFGAENEADLRGFKTVANGPIGGTHQKGNPGFLTPVAALRLTNFNLGLKVGGGIGLIGGSTTYEMVGDLLLALAGHANERSRVTSNLAALNLKGEGGNDPNDFTRVATDLQAQMHFKITAEFLFGLAEADIIDESTPFFHQPIEFQECSFAGLVLGQFPSFDEFWSGATNDLIFANAAPGSRKATIGFGVPPSFAGQANQFNIMLSQFLQPLWCAFGTDDGPLVDSDNPAPSFANLDRPVPGVTTVAAASSAIPVGETPSVPDLIVPAGQTKKLCGEYTFNVVNIQGDIVVGDEGTTDANGKACDGSFDLTARRVTIGAAGDVIADGARRTTFSGRPGGVGGGAGHHSAGGRSGRDKATGGTGPGGPSYAEPNDSDGNPLEIDDFGSPGADGDDDGAGMFPDSTVPGGKGGGTVRITAAEQIINDGQVTANGFSGSSVATRDGDECNTGGGGGSGGHIQLSANIVDGAGTVEVEGGNGGPSGYGGGGGSGGRITIDAIVDDLAGSQLLRDGGSGGTVPGSGDCHTGAPNVPFQTGDGGGGGTERSGTDLDRAANATLHADTPGPLANGTVKVDVVGINEKPFIGSPGPLEIVLCRRTAPWSDPDNLASAALDPVGNSSLAQLTQNADCSEVARFESPNSGPWEYKHTFSLASLSTDLHGFFAYARQPLCPPGNPYSSATGLCTGAFVPPLYDHQNTFPKLSTAKIAVDKVNPTASPITPTVGTSGCPDSSLCLSNGSAGIDITAADQHSQVDTVECRVGSGVYGDCQAKPTTLTLSGEGVHAVDVRVSDKAGNTQEFNDAVKWFVDSRKPNTPTVTVTPVGTEKNGWFRFEPLVSVSASDPNPSAGFDNQPISLFVDEGEVKCGASAAGSASGTGTTTTSCPSGGFAADDIPNDGEHTFTAVVKDRLGNTSDTSAAKTMRVDAKPPKSRFFIGPKDPDGENDWYRTKPFLAFAASDTAGGSGVDPSLDADGVGAGVQFSIDGGPFQAYDPNSTPVLGDGIHEVCFFARDLAGNREDADPGTAGDQNHCVENIKVDSTAPVASDVTTPANPNGANSFYVVKPTVDPDATDPIPGTVPAGEISGVDKVQFNVDDTGWVTVTAANTPVEIQEGEHVIQTRAFDEAGNPSVIIERTVRVDVSKPSAAFGSYPPAPNAQGWMRQPNVLSLAAHDGRDASGADGAIYSIDGGLPASYLRPFSVEDGNHAVSARARDRAGNQGAALARASRVDTVAPFAAPRGVEGNVILSAVLPSSATLKFFADGGDAQRVKVLVQIYDELGTLVRRIQAPGDSAGFRPAGDGSVVWDGRDHTNKGVLPGLYHFRVQAMDQAGNTVLSTESKLIPVILGILPQ